MSTVIKSLLFLLCLCCISACSSQQIVEDLNLILVVGIDLTDDNQLIFSTSNPVFSREAKEKEEHFEKTATSIRNAREEIDSLSLGLDSYGKVQVLLISKKLMQVPSWDRILDPYYRDPKSSNSARLVMLEDSISELMKLRPKDKPRLSRVLTRLLISGVKKSNTVPTTLQNYHTQKWEKGMTPAISAIKIDNGQIKVTGSALLDQKGQYKYSINYFETKLLTLLQHETKGAYPFTMALEEQPNTSDVFHFNQISFNARQIKVTTKTHYKGGKFVFDVGVNLGIIVNERLFPIKQRELFNPEIESQIADQFQSKFNQFIKSVSWRVSWRISGRSSGPSTSTQADGSAISADSTAWLSLWPPRTER